MATEDPEPEMRESRGVFRTIFEEARVGVYQTTLDGRFVRVNPALARLGGYADPAQMLSEVSDIGRQIYVDPEARARLVAICLRDGGTENFVTQVRRRDGRIIWVSVSATLRCDRRGRPLDLIGTAVDVTDLIETQQALAEAERNYRGIIENATEGIYWSSLDGRQLRANPALVRLNGYESEAEMLAAVNDIGAEWYVDPNRRDEFRALMERDGKVTDFESQVYRHKTREIIWVSENARLVRDSSGRPLWYEGTVRDITERKRAEAARFEALRSAEEANRAKTEFLANMSHELRTPLNAIMGFSEMMLRETFGPLGSARYRDYARDINDSAGFLLQLIQDILDMAKAEAGKLGIEEERVDLAAVIDSSVRLLADRARRGEVRLSQRIAGLPHLRADGRRIRQVLLNLISNAVKFTPAGGTVVVEAMQEPGGDILITVADTGIGIAPEDVPRALEPFVQLGRGQWQEGTGLGLPLCQSLIRLHGGSLKLDSRPGAGTTVRIRLPAARAIGGPAAPGENPDELTAPASI